MTFGDRDDTQMEDDPPAYVVGLTLEQYEVW